LFGTGSLSDRNKEKEFLRQRSEYLNGNKLIKNNLTILDLNKIISIFSELVGKKYYDKWYEDWKLKNKAKKYNIAL